MNKEQKKEQANEKPIEETTNEEIKEENSNQEQSIENEEPKKAEENKQEVEQKELEKEEVEVVEQQETAKQEEIQECTETALVTVKKKRKKRKGSYISGTIGAILGGLVAIIPWVLTYILADNMVIPVLATLIPMGVFLGYKIFRGKVRKPFRNIVIVVSLLIIISLTTIICPSILLIQSGYTITWANVTGLYSDTRADVRKVIIEDTVAGLAFGIIGIVLVVAFLINRKLKEIINKEELLEEAKKQLKEKSEILKQACIALNCMNSENAKKKKTILKELKANHKLKKKKRKQYFKECKAAKILVKEKGKYYYDENNIESKLENALKIKNKLKTRKTISRIIVLLILVALVLGGIIVGKEILAPKDNLAGTSIKIEVDKSTQEYYGNDEEITAKFGENAATQCDYVLVAKSGKYEMNGKAIPKSQFEGKDAKTILEENRYYFAAVLGEDGVSEITDKEFGEPNIKSYYYTYVAVDGNEHTSVVYLIEAEDHYVWLSIYADTDIDVTQMDTIVDNFIK